MPIIPAALGAALLSYVVYLISGVGVAVMAFVGIAMLMLAVYMWFWQARANALEIFDIQTTQHYEMMRAIRKMQK